MTVKELINELLECPMGAEVSVLVEVSRNAAIERLKEPDAFPFDDDVEISDVQTVCNSDVRIYLETIGGESNE